MFRPLVLWVDCVGYAVADGFGDGADGETGCIVDYGRWACTCGFVVCCCFSKKSDPYLRPEACICVCRPRNPC